MQPPMTGIVYATLIRRVVINIFQLSECPTLSAQHQCDEHIRKMYIESAQMLSTAHRLLDGEMMMIPALDKNGNNVYLKSGKLRMKKYWKLDSRLETVLYKAVHMGHPSTLWTMESKDNYLWHYKHFLALLEEFTYRFGKVSKTDVQLRYPLSFIPKNIPDIGPTPIKLAMGDNPECMFPNDPVKSYRAFYHTKQSRFAMNWNKNRKMPEWFTKYSIPA